MAVICVCHYFVVSFLFKVINKYMLAHIDRAIEEEREREKDTNYLNGIRFHGNAYAN